MCRHPEILLKGFWFFDFFKYSLQKKIIIFPLHSSSPLNVKLYIMFPTGVEALAGIQELFQSEELIVKWRFLISILYICTVMLRGKVLAVQRATAVSSEPHVRKWPHCWPELS